MASKQTGVSGTDYSGLEYDYDLGGHIVASKRTGVAGQAYTGLEYDYDAAGHLLATKETGFSTGLYNALEYDRTAAGVFTLEILHNNNGTNTYVVEAAGQTVAGTSANETFYSGQGGATFLLGGAFGHDIVRNFAAGSGAGHDKVLFDAGVFASFADLTGHAVQSGADTVITIDAGRAVILSGIARNTLTGVDFGYPDVPPTI